LMILSFVSASVFAQSKISDITIQQMMADDVKSMSKHNEPLYVIDGVIFKGNIKKIDTAGILKIAVLTGPGAVNIYGPQGVNGVVLINTTRGKRPLPVKKTDTISTSLPDSAIYIVDGVITDKKLDGITPQEIFSITILKHEQASQYFESGSKYGTVIIQTKKDAKRAYQKKLGARCKKYQDYLQTHQSYDDDFCYVVDGVVVTGKDSGEVIKKLYDIPGEKVKSVDIMENTFRNGNKEKQIVTITTRK
jgi:hypothetical protein